MKNKYVSGLLLAVLFLLFCAGVAYAEDGQCGDNVYYSTTSDGAVTIYGTGDMWDFAQEGANASPFAESSLITQVTVGAGVTSIGNFSFHHCENLSEVSFAEGLRDIGMGAFWCCGLSSVDFPDSLEHIDLFSFERCENLTTIHIPANVSVIKKDSFAYCFGNTAFTADPANPYFTAQDGILFSKDQSILRFFPCAKEGESYAIPSGVTEIGDYAFFRNSTLSSVTIPNTVRRIGVSAFEGTDLASVVVSGNNCVLEDRAFYSCIYLENLTLGAGIKEIGYCAFYGDPVLKSVEIPYGVTTIREGAFHGCTGLEFIVIPETVQTIETGILAYAGPDYTIYCKEGSAAESYAQSNTLPYRIYDRKCGNAVFYDLDGSVLHIFGKGPMEVYSNPVKPSPFYQNTAIEEVIIEKGVTTVSQFSFYLCSNLERISLPSDSLTYIGSSAFSGCSSLRAVAIPSSVTRIGGKVFENCSALEQLYVHGQYVEAGDDFVEKTDSLVIWLRKDSEVYTIAVNKDIPFILLDPVNGIDLRIPNHVTVIGEEAFAGTRVTAVDVNVHTERIESRAFADCKQMRLIVLHENVSYIADDAFEGCPQNMIIYCREFTPVYDYARAHGFLVGALPMS